MSIYCFGNDIDTYECLKKLTNAQVEIDGIITLFDDMVRNKEVFGIKLVTYDGAKVFFDSSTIIYVSKKEYLRYSRVFAGDGFRIGKNIIIDFPQKNRKIVSCYCAQFMHLIYLLPSRLVNECKRKITIARSYIRQFGSLYRGIKVYSSIKSSNKNNTKIYIYDYTGLGDVYIICGLLRAKGECDYVLTVRNISSMKIANKFNVPAVVLSDKQSYDLTTVARVYGKTINCVAITPFPRNVPYDMVSRVFGGKRLNMLELYRYMYLNMSQKTGFVYPSNIATSEKTLSMLKQVPKHKTVILSPYANTVIGYKACFWEELAERIAEQGYYVITNCGPNEKSIKGTERMSFPLDDIENTIDYAGYFIGVRSGFCDLICNTEARKIILYPIYPIFNSDVYEFCSLKKMGIGRNVIEIQWKYDNFTDLTDIIINLLIKSDKEHFING